MSQNVPPGSAAAVPRRGRCLAVRSTLAPAAAIAQLNVGRIGNRWHPRHETDGMRPVIVGEISDQGVRLLVRRANSRNALRPMLRGRIVATPGGSELAGSFGLHPFTRGLLAFWFGLLALMLLVIVLNLGSFASGWELLSALGGVLGLGGLGAALVALGIRSGAQDEAVMRDWLEIQLGAGTGPVR